jgi:hydroxymethylglutaryl-CoA synthase
MREALEDYESVAGDIHPDDFAYIPFHTPFPGMVRKAALLGYRHMTRDTDVERALAGEIGLQPRQTDFPDRESYEEAIRGYMDDLKGTDRYREWYEAAIEPTLGIASRVGNWYTGSVHLARASVLRSAARADRDLAGERLLVASYGSGAQAEVHVETVQAEWAEEIAALDVGDQLAGRYDLSYEEYERVHDAHNHDKDTEFEEFTPPEDEFVFAGWGRMDERIYEYVE